MPTEKIKKANEISSLITGWGKILFIIGSAIGSGFLLYYQIQNNSTSIQNLELKIDDNNKANEREFEINEERSNKRYDRAMKTGDILLKQNAKQNDWLLDLDKRISYIEGNLKHE
jgi:hypothetical protein